MEGEATFVRRLAERAAGVTYESLPDEALHQIKRAVLDRIGCALGGWRIGANHELIGVLRELGGAPEATIWGDGGRVPAHHAALAVGAISEHLEYDAHDGMIPAAFATGEWQHSSGEAVIAAVAAGYDVKNAVRKLLASEVEAHGLHWPGQLSVYSATTAACKLLGATADQIAAALSFAGCLSPVAPFEAFTKGASVKDLYGGWGEMVGVMAARLCRVGFSGPSTLFEGRRGLGRTWLHGIPSPENMEEAFSEKNAITGLGFKPFPTCTSAHPALSAVELLLSRNPCMDVGEIERIEVGTYAYAVELSTDSVADTPISAKLNLPYLCAVMLLDGVLDVEHTEEPRLNDPRIQELAGKVMVYVLPDTDTSLRERRRPATVTVTLQNGERFEASVDEPRWRQNSLMSDADLEEKFRRLVADLMPATRREELIQVIWELENVADIGDVTAYLV